METLFKKLNGISESFIAHANSAIAGFGDNARSLDIVPFVITRGYRDWLMDNRALVLDEIRRTQSEVARQGIELPEADVNRTLDFVDQAIAEMTKMSDLLLRSLFEAMPREEQREAMRTKIIELLDNVTVDERSWSVSYNGPQVQIVRRKAE